MKKLYIIISSLILLFASCDLWDADLVSYLEYYSNSAGIGHYELDSNYPEINSVSHIQGGSARKITFLMRNPQHYTLDFEVDWKNKPIGDTVPLYNTDYTLTQDTYDSVVMTLTEDFITQLDNNADYGDISATIHLETNDGTTREFDSFSYNLIVNSPPTKPSSAAFLKHEDLLTWILAFDLSSTNIRKTKDSDIRTISVNGQNYPINVDYTDGSFTLSGDLTTDENAVKQNKDIDLVDNIGQLYIHTDNTVYYVTDIPTKDNPSASIRFIDSRGLSSETTTVNTVGLIKTQFYVSETKGSDQDGTASQNNPYKTLQKAIDTILANNDSSQVYTIFVSGDVGNGTIVPTSAKAHNIRIQGYESLASNSIRELSIEQNASNITLVDDIDITNLFVSNGANVTLSGASIENLEYKSTNVLVSATEKPSSAITIKLPTNTVNNTHLISNSGANFTVSNFELDTSNTGSLFINNGNLYYSTHKKVTWSQVISNNSVEEAGQAGFSQVTIDSTFNVSPSPVQISFADADTVLDEKIEALENALVKAFTGKITSSMHAVEPIEISDINVLFEDLRVDITLKATNGYTFNQESIETTKVVSINLGGSFGSYTKINWTGISTDKIEKESGTAEFGAFTISESFMVSPNPVWIYFHDDDLLLADKQQDSIKSALTNALALKLPEGAELPQERITLVRNGYNVKTGRITLVLVAKEGYIFTPASGNVSEVEISIPVESTADFGNIEIIDINTIGMRAPDNSSIDGAFTGTWSIKDALFDSADAKVTLSENSSSSYVDIANAVKNAIVGDNFSIAMTTPTASDMPVGDTVFTATLTANSGYLFTDNEGSIEIEIPFTLVKTIADSDIVDTAIKPTLANATASGTWALSNGTFSGAESLSTIVIEPNKSITSKTVADELKKVISIENTTIEISPSGSDILALGSQAFTATLSANDNYIFEGNTRIKEISIRFTVKQLVSGNITTVNVDAATGNAGFPSFIIENFVNRSESASFVYDDIVQRASSIVVGLNKAFNGAVMPANVTRDTTNISHVTVTNGEEAVGVKLIFNTAGNYVFDIDGSQKKEVTFIIPNGSIPSKTTYYVSEHGNDDNAGITSVNAFASVQRAVDVLNAYNATGATTIIINGNITNHGTNSSSHSMVEINGDGKVRNITLQGPSSGTMATINANNGGKRVLNISGSSTSVTLGSNLKLTGGKTTGNGGGVLVTSGNLTIDGGTITNNTAANGGGIYNYSSAIKLKGEVFIHSNTGGNITYNNDTNPIQVTGSLKNSVITISASNINEGNEVAKGDDGYTLTTDDRDAFESDTGSRIFQLYENEIVENILADVTNTDSRDSINSAIYTAVNHSIPTTIRVTGEVTDAYDIIIEDTDATKATITIQGPENGTGTLNASSKGRVLNITNSNVILGKNIVITGGRVVGDNGTDQGMAGPTAGGDGQGAQGGGIYLNGGSLTMLENAKITGNTVQGGTGGSGSYGWGVANSDNGQNGGPGGKGGAANGAGIYVNNGTLTLKDTASIVNNIATGGNGGTGGTGGSSSSGSGRAGLGGQGGAGANAEGAGVYVSSGNLYIEGSLNINNNTANGGIGGQGGQGGSKTGGVIWDDGSANDGGTGGIGGSSFGGGIYFKGTTFTLNKGVIQENKALGGSGGNGGNGGYEDSNGSSWVGAGGNGGAGGESKGGGIYISSGSFTNDSSTINSNTAQGGKGGSGGTFGGGNSGDGPHQQRNGNPGAGGVATGGGVYSSNSSDIVNDNNTVTNGAAGG